MERKKAVRHSSCHVCSGDINTYRRCIRCHLLRLPVFDLQLGNPFPVVTDEVACQPVQILIAGQIHCNRVLLRLVQPV